MAPSIRITRTDLKRLFDLLFAAREFRFREREDLRDFQKELDRAKVVDSKQVPSDVVTMNSRIRLRDLDRDTEMVLTLVYPRDADPEKGRISVLSPVGTAILGYSVNVDIEWNVPAGKRHYRVEEILYQPEAAGDYHL